MTTSEKEMMAIRAAALPKALPERSSLAAAVSSAATRSLSSALELIKAAGGTLSAADAQEVLRNRTKRIRSLKQDEHDVSQEFEFCEILIAMGADPLMVPKEKPRWAAELSLIAALARCGAWSYAANIAERFGKQASREALIAEAPEPPDGLLEMLARGGPGGIALANKLGMDMSATVAGAPWAAMSANADDLAAFAKAGADLSAKDERGRSLAEIFAQRPAGKARQSLVQAIAELLTGGDKDSAIKMMERIAQEGAFKELAALAKGAGVDPATAKTADGRSLLAIAARSANWTMARDLLKAGASPAEPSGPSGIPSGAFALVGMDAKKQTKARENAEKECLASLFAGIDFSWRSAAGERALEAVAAETGATGRAFSWNLPAVEALARAEPDSANKPMWERAIDLKMPDDAVAGIAGIRIGESAWRSDGLGTLEWAVSKQHSSWSSGRSILGTLLCSRGWELSRHMSGRLTAPDKDLDIFAIDQWSGAAAWLWTAAASSAKKTKDGMSEWSARREIDGGLSRFQEALRYWVVRAATRGKTPFSAEHVAEWAFGGWSDEDPESGAVAGGVIIAALGAGMHVASKAMLDLAQKQTPAAAKAANDIWREMGRKYASPKLPEDHAIYKSEWTPSEELARTELWTAVLELRERVAVPYASKARRL